MSLSPEDGVTLRSRPKLRRDVVFLDAPTGAYLRGPDSAFLIRGRSAFRWLTSLGPYLTGEHTVAQLTADLDESQQRTVLTLVRALLGRGFAKDAGERTAIPAPVAQRFAAQIEFIDHFADDPTGRFLRMHEARVALTGGGEVVRAAAQALLANGCVRLDLHLEDPDRCVEALRPRIDELSAAGLPAELRVRSGPLDAGQVDAVIACVGPAGLSGLADLARAAHRDGPLLVPVTWDDERAVVGPVVAAGASPCWLCAHLRLTDTAAPTAAAAFWRHVAVGSDARPAPPTVTARMLGTAVAFETFRALTGALAPDTDSRVLLIDTVTLESTRERVLRHPGCPVCRTAPNAVPAPSAGSAEELYQRAEVLVSPNAGVFTRFVDDPLEQAPLKTARLRLPGRHGPREITAFDVHTVMGARLAAYRTAVRDHAARHADPAGAVVATAAQLREQGHDPVRWAELETASGVAVDDPHRPLRWLPATVLGAAGTVLVPAAAVLPLSDANADGHAERTTAGSAADADIEGVIDGGLADALGWHALTAVLRGRAATVPVDEEELIRDDDTAFIVKAAHRLGCHLSVHVLADAAPVAAVLAVVAAPDGGRRRWALAADFDPVAARLAAVRDAVGQVQVEHFEEILPDLGDPLLGDLEPALPAGAPVTTGPARPTERAAVLAALAARGTDALLVETTPSDIRASATFRSGVVLLRNHGRTAD
ncbi:TOMM precursor leader peptide-binding protein [Micromonospora sp. NPDC005220]|uniref:TOMM precursor leader peptide-binding protein n=1 Tax=Micromonospora sp. NPDC005220 TaxID=3155589 RepID=UPI0033A18C03